MEVSFLETENATLELQEGSNLLRIEALGPGGATDNDLPQVFELRIGPDELSLEGGLSIVCIGTRNIEPTVANPGQTVIVTVTAKNIAGPTTIVEEFPAGWTVTFDGGGTVNENESTITFNLDSDEEITYELAAAADCLEEPAEFGGMITGPGDCDEEVGGDSTVRCVEAF